MLENIIALTVTPTDNWLDTSDTLTNWQDWTGGTTSCNIHYNWCSCHWHGGKIRLSLKEVDTLRKAAKKDSKLKEVLNKLTPKIEVEIEL